MGKFELITKNELDRLGKRTRLFFAALLVMLVLFYVQGRFLTKEGGQGRLPPASSPQALTFRDGDMVFQESLGDLAGRISRVTESPFNHCGMVVIEGDGIFVLEAAGHVELTPLDRWVKSGAGRKFALARVKNLSEDDARRVVEAGKHFLGRPYDSLYQWDDEKIYCSELVFKAFKNGAGLEPGTLRAIRDFRWQVEEDFLRRHYGGKIPLDMQVAAPVDVFRSPLVEVIYNDFSSQEMKSYEAENTGGGSPPR
jgi:hypothetical protein